MNIGYIIFDSLHKMTHVIQYIREQKIKGVVNKWHVLLSLVIFIMAKVLLRH